jgi:hypothetical protein
LVRKYFEIGACGSIPCGNINQQGKYIFKDNIIELNENMSDYEILRIIKYYLSNPDILIKMSNSIKNIVINYNYNMFMKKILEIKDNIINNIDSDLLFLNKKKEYSLINNQIKIHKILNTTKLLKWFTNQKTTIDYDNKNKIFNVTINQDKSTPGIKTTLIIKPGQYILSYIFNSLTLKSSIFCFDNLGQITINELNNFNLNSGFFNIITEKTYTIYILITNPKIGEKFTVKDINLKQIEYSTLVYKNDLILSHIENNFNSHICYGSISCASELNKLYSTFGGIKLNKDDILKKTWIKSNILNNSKYFVLLGLYSPHHWDKIYKPLFDKFERVMIIFTGTDIIQLEKINTELKETIYSTLKTNKFILGALNTRNQEEILQTHNLDCNIISIPVDINLPQNSNQIISNKIAYYVGNNLEWYCFDILKKVATILPNYEFYIYKFGGFTDEFINESSNAVPNIIYNKSTIENFEEFMQDKLCSLRITLHDGEPMTGIETMVMGKYFIFNHLMKYSIQTTNDPIDIVEKINKVYELVSKKIYPDLEVKNYYLYRNSNKIFERNLYGYFSLPNNIYTILENNKEIIIDQLKFDKYTINYNANVNPNTKYSVVLNGWSNSYCKLELDLNSNIIITNSKYNKIENFESISWIEFKSKTKSTQIKINIVFGSPNINDILYIKNLQLIY